MNKADTSQILTAYKYLLTDRGVVFIINTTLLTKPDGNISLNIAKSENAVFLQLGQIHCLLTQKIIEHLHKLMEQKEIVIAFAQSALEEYEIKIAFSVGLNQVDCATLISLYKIAQEQQVS